MTGIIPRHQTHTVRVGEEEKRHHMTFVCINRPQAFSPQWGEGFALAHLHGSLLEGIKEQRLWWRSRVGARSRGVRLCMLVLSHFLIMFMCHQRPSKTRKDVTTATGIEGLLRCRGKAYFPSYFDQRRTQSPADSMLSERVRHSQECNNQDP
ncbi:hypothetical protein IF2G_06666 [Cordyceps javanica]|nr:hypothetical protein IF2G_06666 [Cordyceps javanica]